MYIYTGCSNFVEFYLDYLTGLLNGMIKQIVAFGRYKGSTFDVKEDFFIQLERTPVIQVRSHNFNFQIPGHPLLKFDY